MRQHKQASALNRRPTVLYLVCTHTLFSVLLFFIWCARLHCSPSCSSHLILSLRRIPFFSTCKSEIIRVLSNIQSSVQQCVYKRGLELTAHIIDHCNLILKYPEGTNSSWYNAQFNHFEPLEYKYDVCEAILLWELYRNMTTVLTREYLDSRPGGWMDYTPQRIAPGTKKCTNKTLCEENLNVLLPAKLPFHPRQFRTCAVVGNSGDLLKTTFGKEIDSHDAVIQDNEAPVNEECAVLRGISV